MAKYPKMSDSAKVRASRGDQPRSKGRFSAAESAESSITTVNAPNPSATLPPNANLDYSSLFVAPPNPVNKVFYNPDEAFLSNPENASRMIQDQAIFAPLQERMLATAAQPWSIVPQDEEESEQQTAAQAIEDIIRSFLPSQIEFFLNFLWSVWFGRMASYVRYEWDFSIGKRRMVPKAWTPVHGDTLVFGENGRIGYRVGATNGNKQVQVGVPGRFIAVGEEPLKLGDDGVAELTQPEERKAWIVHHHQKTAGEFRIFTSAAAIYGLGLRSRVYPTWLLKSSALQFQMQAAEKFGSGWVIGWFDGGNDKSAIAMRNGLQKQVGSCTLLLPRFAPDEMALEGVEVIDPPSAGFEAMANIIAYYDDQMAVTIKGQKLTSENEKGGGLGSSKAEVQESTFGRLIKYDSGALGETLTNQFVRVLQDFNGYGHLPTLRFEFSFDIGSTKEKLENAKTIYDMGGRFDTTPLMQDCGLTPLKDPLANPTGETIDTTGLEATNEIDTTEEDATGELETVPPSQETPADDQSGNEFENNDV